MDKPSLAEDGRSRASLHSALGIEIRCCPLGDGEQVGVRKEVGSPLRE
jgi:hypothetical protein